MTIKEKILEILIGNRFTVKEITQKLNEKKYQLNTNENRVRVYINRLKKDNLIEKCTIDNRYKVYKLISDSNTKSIEIIDKLVFLMIKAEIKSEDYGIEIKESEIHSSIKRLMESGKIG